MPGPAEAARTRIGVIINDDCHRTVRASRLHEARVSISVGEARPLGAAGQLMQLESTTLP